jgi:hypothetical protein
MYKNVKVADVLSHTPLNIRSKHVLRDDRQESWLHFVEHLMGVHLNDEVGWLQRLQDFFGKIFIW